MKVVAVAAGVAMTEAGKTLTWDESEDQLPLLCLYSLEGIEVEVVEGPAEPLGMIEKLRSWDLEQSSGWRRKMSGDSASCC